MAQYTELKKEDINAILATYEVEEAQSFEILSGGYQNTNYLVRTDHEKYVLTICEDKAPKEAGELSQLLEDLAKSNFETSKVIRDKKNKAISLWGTKPVMLKKFLEGKIVEDFPNHLLFLIGGALASLHQVPVPAYLPQRLSYGIEYFHEVEQYAPHSFFLIWLKKMQTYIEQHISADLPRAIIHSDLFFNNVIVSEDEQQVFIMDFEEARNYYRVYDIGMTIIGSCSEGKVVNLEKARCLIQGYQKIQALLEIELRALQAFTTYSAVATAFWRHRQFNFIHPSPEFANRYLVMQDLAQFVKDLPADHFL